MTVLQSWLDIVIHTHDPTTTWESIFNKVQELSLNSKNADELRRNLYPGDRLISEAGWELWENYSNTANLASKKLIEFINNSSSQGKAILILDALSIYEFSLLLDGAKKQAIPVKLSGIYGSQIPSDTDSFARALGIQGRNKLENNSVPSKTIFAEKKFYTDVTNYPFEDCINSIKPEPNILLWHTFLDDMLHDVGDLELFKKQVAEKFSVDSFWKLIEKMRQGRDLLILSDHGYGISYYYREETGDTAKKLKEVFGAKRYVKAEDSNITKDFVPPTTFSYNKYLTVMGPRKWKAQGGYPMLCHGGLTLAEISVPVIEIDAKQ